MTSWPRLKLAYEYATTGTMSLATPSMVNQALCILFAIGLVICLIILYGLIKFVKILRRANNVSTKVKSNTSTIYKILNYLYIKEGVDCNLMMDPDCSEAPLIRRKSSKKKKSKVSRASVSDDEYVSPTRNLSFFKNLLSRSEKSVSKPVGKKIDDVYETCESDSVDNGINHENKKNQTRIARNEQAQSSSERFSDNADSYYNNNFNRHYNNTNHYSNNYNPNYPPYYSPNYPPQYSSNYAPQYSSNYPPQYSSNYIPAYDNVRRTDARISNMHHKYQMNMPNFAGCGPQFSPYDNPEFTPGYKQHHGSYYRPELTRYIPDISGILTPQKNQSIVPMSQHLSDPFAQKTSENSVQTSLKGSDDEKDLEYLNYLVGNNINKASSGKILPNELEILIRSSITGTNDSYVVESKHASKLAQYLDEQKKNNNYYYNPAGSYLKSNKHPFNDYYQKIYNNI